VSRRLFASLDRPPERKSAASTTRSTALPTWSYGKPYDPSGWDLEKAVRDGLHRSTWVSRCVTAIAANQASLRFVVRQDDRDDGPEVEDHFLGRLLNQRPNEHEGAFALRMRLSMQLLLSRRGAFLEVVRSNGGEPVGLSLLPAHRTRPIPDPRRFVSGFEVLLDSGRKDILRPDNVVWFRLPDPIDPYLSLTPLEAAGLAVDTDWYARLYLRNFLMNDGRPAGLLNLRGQVSDDDARELRDGFNAGPGAAGKTRVVSGADGIDYADLSVTARDAQHVETRKGTRDEILMAFGVPESMLGHAADRTFQNARVERLAFWQETMALGHLPMLAGPLDRLDDREDTFCTFDLTGVDVLEQEERERRQGLAAEVAGGLLAWEEYRELTGRDEEGSRKQRTVLLPDNVTPVQVGDRESPQHVHAAPPEETRPVRERPDEDEQDEPVTVASLHASRRKGFADDPAAAIEALRARWERPVTAVLRQHFGRQRRHVLAVLASAKFRHGTRFWEQRTPDRDVKAVDWDSLRPARWPEELTAEMAGLYAELMEDVAEQQLAALAGDDAPAFNVRNPEVTEAIGQLTNRLRGVEDTTWAEVRSALAHGEAAGEGIEQLAARVREVFDGFTETRAVVIARTEVVGASNAGSFMAAKQSNVVARKRWLAIVDQRTRQSHRDADGQIVAMNEMFSVGGAQMAYPGDPAAPADEVIQCRCSLTYDSAQPARVAA